MTTGDVGELYGLPLADFTKQRNVLAEELRAAGDEEAAESVRSLKKPTLPVWAVNQVARRHGDLIDELVDLQAQLAGAGSRTAMRRLAEARRDLVNRLLHEAEAILKDSGHAAGSDTLQKISRTLLAAGDEETLELMRSGRLDRELTGSGFEQVFGALPDDPADEDEELQQEERARAAEELEKKAAAAEQRATALSLEADDLRRQADETAEAAADARAEAERLRSEADAAAR